MNAIHITVTVPASSQRESERVAPAGWAGIMSSEPVHVSVAGVPRIVR